MEGLDVFLGGGHEWGLGRLKRWSGARRKPPSERC
jgi:hypothetical protein